MSFLNSFSSRLAYYKRKVSYWAFIYRKPTVRFTGRMSDGNSTLLLSIAYNEFSLVEQQIYLLKKYFTDPFLHIVVDNSSDELIRTQIQKICKEQGVEYAGVPANPYTSNKSHGAAMHWAYFQLIKNSKFKRFGFLDHDIFPTAPFSLENRMKNGIYGRVMHTYFKAGYHENYSPVNPYWSLWAGFCFFEKKSFSGRFPWSLNFFSKHFKDGNFLDTGGGLWDKLYSKLDYPGELATYRTKRISDEPGDEIQNQSFEILDESWIHFVSLSNWRRIADLDKKKALLVEILQSHK